MGFRAQGVYGLSFEVWVWGEVGFQGFTVRFGKRPASKQTRALFRDSFAHTRTAGIQFRGSKSCPLAIGLEFRPHGVRVSAWAFGVKKVFQGYGVRFSVGNGGFRVGFGVQHPWLRALN